MKRIYQAIILVVSMSCMTTAQNSIQFSINHMLGEKTFVYNEGSTNNMGHDFNVTRLEYYISKISVVHDGGMETTFEDVYVLVDASNNTSVDLGQHDIEKVEKVRFHIGVDQETNHLDPSLYPMGHPLAPKFPSMHWGWAAGYRFVAIEGFGGASYNQLYQLHGLGDNNYYQTEIDVNTSAENGLISIELNANYSRSLENIGVNGGVIVHGDNLQAQLCLQNFRDYVFENASVVSNSEDISDISHFSIVPNPATDGFVNLELEVKDDINDYRLFIANSNGKIVKSFDQLSNGTRLAVADLPAGFYHAQIIKNANSVAYRKLVVR